MKTLILALLIAAASATLFLTTGPAYEGSAGFAKARAFAPVRQQEIDFHLWYPANAGGREITVGGNGVFYGTPAGKGAPAREGRHPVVIISHGAGGNAGQFGWIAAQLAQAGFVVALPNHPGTTSRNASASAAVRVWERPQDVSAVIDRITASPQDFPYADPNRIGVLGFSAGGYTAMALAGARVDPEALAQFCDDSDHGMSDCAFLAKAGIDLHQIDLSPAAADLRDPRVKTGVIIDPGIIQTITQDSLRAMPVPLQIINLDDPVPAGVDAAKAASVIPRAEYHRIKAASHFSFLANCKPRGAEILRDEGEPDLLCADGQGTDRQAIHDGLAALILPYLTRMLKP